MKSAQAANSSFWAESPSVLYISIYSLFLLCHGINGFACVPSGSASSSSLLRPGETLALSVYQLQYHVPVGLHWSASDVR